MTRPRILLADDHLPLLEAAAALLKPHFDVVGTVKNGGVLVSDALLIRPDVIVTDITMPVLNGIEAIQRLRESNFSPRVVILTIHSEDELLKACMAEGALGYVLKSHMKAHLVPAIQAALAGQRYVSPMGSSRQT